MNTKKVPKIGSLARSLVPPSTQRKGTEATKHSDYQYIMRAGSVCPFKSHPEVQRTEYESADRETTEK